MADASNIPAWIALFVGIYSLSASIGEFTRPGTWVKMLSDFEKQPGLRFISGVFLIGLGSAVYLVSPWRPDDWLAILVTIMGAGMVLEGALFLAFGEQFTRFSQALLGNATRVWSLFSAALGIALIVVALGRL